MQTHSPVSEADATQSAHTLEYATRRFIQTVINPSTNREESNFAMAAYITVNASPTVPIENQSKTVPGPDALLVHKLVKYCTHYCMLYHTQKECSKLGNGQPSGKGNAGGGGKGKGKGNGEGKRYSKDNKDKDKSDDRANRARHCNDSDSEAETYVIF